MSRTTVSRRNAYRPSPRWFRITKKIVYGIFVTTMFTGLLQRLGVSDADITLISGFIVTIMETLSSILANGEDYVKTR